MTKRILTIAIAFIMLFAVSVTASAEDPVLGFESSYNADTDVVTVSIYINNALGLQAADLSLAFDTQMYEFESCETADTNDGMIIAGLTKNIPGLCSCSVIFTEQCLEADLDENGRLNLATYTFKPVSDEYDINEFCFWATSFEVDGVNVVRMVKAQGNTGLQEEKTDSVTIKQTQANENDTTKKSTQSVFGDISSKWYVYLIAGVLAVGAIAGIAFVAIRSSHNEESEKSDENSENNDN